MEPYELKTPDDPVAETALRMFGIPYLYPWQRLVIANILDAAEEQARDSPETDLPGRSRQIALLPTGAGKSLCFLIPALMLKGPTLIIYPLLALMSDQERRIRERGIEPVIFRGGQSPQERERGFEKLAGGARIILANPEVLQSAKICERLRSAGIAHLAVDEAHCVCEWGDTFRPAYLSLGKIIERLNPAVVTAFTATASPPVLVRVSEILFGGGAHIVQGECDRPNIRYSVTFACAKKQALAAELLRRRRPALVFCPTRHETEKTARFIRDVLEEQEVRFYHAGLERDEKNIIEQWFHGSTGGILTATCAYGMGVDKKNIRTVIHLAPPATAEAYIQEAGRGGRDGEPAEALLLWSPEDKSAAKQFPPGSRGRVLGDFAESGTCRRRVLLDALGDSGETACSGCDICDGSAVQTAADAEAVMEFIKLNRRTYTPREAAAVIAEMINKATDNGSGIKRWTTQAVNEIITALLTQNRLRILSGFIWNRKLDLPGGRSEVPQQGSFGRIFRLAVRGIFGIIRAVLGGRGLCGFGTAFRNGNRFGTLAVSYNKEDKIQIENDRNGSADNFF
ncbi:MAG: RecQ family ATP-dependent DNA helicase [Spirochaetaceae bacterium]|jgi:ATP-dependent DNA helicase RecQ|nr:RecQ family ATP-dependent DNA helicase [Spirochaetaceae bacterium]